MRRILSTLTLLMLNLGAVAEAQIRPQAGALDPRIQQVEYRADQVVLVEAAVGFQVTIELAPDEQIESAALGDSAAWQITPNRSGNRLFAKPLTAGINTNLTVVTNVRTYAFDLQGIADPGLASPYTIRFNYPRTREGLAATPPTSTARAGLYKLSGARALRPAGISDDGAHTFIEWAADVALPATYTIDDHGREMLANGNMRDGLYVIDGIANRLVFRLDKQAARAKRLPPPETQN